MALAEFEPGWFSSFAFGTDEAYEEYFRLVQNGNGLYTHEEVLDVPVYELAWIATRSAVEMVGPYEYGDMDPNEVYRGLMFRLDCEVVNALDETKMPDVMRVFNEHWKRLT